MAIKNHIIKSFKVSEELYKRFEEAAEGTQLKKSDLSRLLFNRALSQLIADKIKAQGWENLQIAIKELN